MWYLPEASKEEHSGTSVGAWSEPKSEKREVEKFVSFLPPEHDITLRHVSGSIPLPLVSDKESIRSKIFKEYTEESNKLEQSPHHVVWKDVSEVEDLSVVVLVPLD